MFCLSLIPVQNLAKIEPKVIRGLSVFKIYMYVLERCENNGSIYENKLFLLDRFVMTAEIFLVSNHITNWQWAGIYILREDIFIYIFYMYF